MNAAAEKMPDPSPFARAYADLSGLGYSCIPLIPASVMHQKSRGKAPGRYQSGGWSGLKDWQELRTAPLSGFKLSMAMKMNEANVGVCMGTPAGRLDDGTPLFLVCIDVDTEDVDAFDEIVRAIPNSPMRAKGKKGFKAFYRAPATVKSRGYDDARVPAGQGLPRRLVDVLTGFDTRQAVCPPSLHPETMQPYVWLAGPVRADELPIFDEGAHERLVETLQGLGYDPEAGRQGRADRKPYLPADHDADNVFDRVKAAALANLDAWVPALDLYGCRRTRDGKYKAVASWRPSSSGRVLSERATNLAISADGIKDCGANEGYSAIDLVMAALDVSIAEAVTWLEERLGLTEEDDGAVIDIAALLASRGERELPPPLRGLPDTKTPAPSFDDAGAREAVLGGEEKDAAAADIRPTHDLSVELPAHLCRVPGLVGDIADWITATARKPQPSLSLAMALGLVGTVSGRKFCGPTQSATHLFMMCTGPTGSGKNAPKKAAAQLLAAASLRGLIGPSSFTSASALIQHVSRSPASLCVMDEFSMLIGKLNAKNNSTHERAISGEMRQFWSLSFEEYVPPRWAAARDRAQPEPIISPALSIIGLTTADEVYSVLQGADTVSGFLNRFLLVATLNNPLDVEPSADVFDPPAALVKGLQSIAGVGGALTQATMHMDRADRPLVSVPWEDGPGSTAHNVFKALVAEVAAMTENEALTQRTAEIAVRLATIRAIGIAGEHAKVTVDDMAWGASFAMWSTKRLIADVEAHMVESDHQGRAKFVLRTITEAPGGYLTRTALCRKVNHRFDARVLDTVLDGLLEAGQLRLKESERRGQGRKASGYFAA